MKDIKWIPVDDSVEGIRKATEKMKQAASPYVNEKKEFTNDSEENVAKGAIKYDGGKSPIYRGCLSYFPRSVEAVAAVSAFGASKYAWRGWESVDDGFNRYSDALVRHLTYEGKGEVLDPDSGLLHAAHTAWNALARLELLIRERDGLKVGPQQCAEKDCAVY